MPGRRDDPATIAGTPGGRIQLGGGAARRATLAPRGRSIGQSGAPDQTGDGGASGCGRFQGAGKPSNLRRIGAKVPRRILACQQHILRMFHQFDQASIAARGRARSEADLCWSLNGDDGTSRKSNDIDESSFASRWPGVAAGWTGGALTAGSCGVLATPLAPAQGTIDPGSRIARPAVA
jgi:hypothetical protein